MPDPVVHIAGTGSFAAEVIEFAQAAGFRVAGLVEPIDPARIGGEAHGLPILDPAAPPRPGAPVVVAVGQGRLRIRRMLADAGWGAETIAHPSAVVSPSAVIGAGVVIAPLVVIGAQARVGDHALLGRGALVGHHTTIGEGSTLNPGANIAGSVTLGDAVTVGMGAAVAPLMTVGDGALIAAGAVVVRDVPAGVRVQGVPAREFATEGIW